MTERKTSGTSLKRAIIIGISLLFIIFFGRVVPPPSGMSGEAMQVLGIFIGVLILWMTISIDWPSMLCIAAIAFLPSMSMSGILAASIGNATFAFLMFTFMCTYTLSQTPFIRRCAIAFVTSGIARKGPWAFLVLYFASVLFLGAFMSPTVLVIIFITISEEIFAVLGLEKGSKTANMMMMGMMFCSGIAAGMTPIAHVFPLIAMGLYTEAGGEAIGYASYMAAGIPVALLAFAFMLLMFRFVLRPDVKEIKTLDVTSLKAALPKMDHREVATVVIFFAVVALWVLPGVIKPVAPALAAYIDSFGTAMPPLLGAIAMAIVTFKGKPLLDFAQATGKGIPWASLIMTAGTLTLGAAMTNTDIGLTSWLADSIAPFAATLAPMALVLLFSVWASIQTNLSSNMVTATVVTTIAIPLCAASAGAVNGAAVTVVIGMMSAYAFATPPAMATVVFAIGSGWTTTGSVARYGFLLMAASALLAAFVGYPIAAALL